MRQMLLLPVETDLYVIYPKWSMEINLRMEEISYLRMKITKIS